MPEISSESKKKEKKNPYLPTHFSNAEK